MDSDSYISGRHDYLKPNAVLEQASWEKMRPVRYVLPDYLPIGKLSILGGAPKDGKSTLLCAIAARVTNGGTHSSWPDERPTTAGNVVFISREDEFNDTITPRLAAAGADLGRVRNLAGVKSYHPELEMFDWSDEHIQQFCNAVKSWGDVTLIIVDPALQAIAGDTNNNQKVQRGFERLALLAKSLDCAIVGLVHVMKSAKGKDPLSRIAGPLAVGGVPRSVLITAPIKNEECGIDGSHVLVRVATLNKGEGGYSYSIESCEVESPSGIIETSKIVWKEQVEGTATEIFQRAESKISPRKTAEKLADAMAFLQNILKDGPRTKPEIEQLAKEANVSDRYLLMAKKELGIISSKQEGAGQFSPFEWRLPDEKKST